MYIGNSKIYYSEPFPIKEIVCLALLFSTSVMYVHLLGKENAKNEGSWYGFKILFVYTAGRQQHLEI